MAFWTHGNSGDSRRTRVGGIAPTSSSSASAARTAAANLFRDRDSPIDTDEMFFETTPTVSFPSRSRWADRMASSVFDDFPPRRMGSNFPAAAMDPTSFGSLHRHRQPPSWMSDARGSKESSPARSEGGSLPRHSTFHRADSIPVHVAHESSRHGSRSSTPESTGSGSASSRPASVSAADQNHLHQDGDVSDGVEEHPMATSRAGKQGFMARHQPKVHHIPIHVEPRDGHQQSFTTLTPPVVESPQPMPFNVVYEQPQSRSPPVQEVRRSSFPNDQPAPPKRSFKAQRHPSGLPKPMSGGGWEIPVQQEPAPAEPTAAHEEAPQPFKPKKKTAFEILEEVNVDIEKLKENVTEFKGSKGDKAYVYLDEMLTRNLIRLDNIETEGNEELRQARRAVITSISECIHKLEHIASGNDDAAGAEEQRSTTEEMDTKVEEEEAEAENGLEEVEVKNEMLAVDEENVGSITEVADQSCSAVEEGEVSAPTTSEDCVQLPETFSEPSDEVVQYELEVETPAIDEPTPVVQELHGPKCVEEPMECQETVEPDKIQDVTETLIVNEATPEQPATEEVSSSSSKNVVAT